MVARIPGRSMLTIFCSRRRPELDIGGQGRDIDDRRETHVLPHLGEQIVGKYEGSAISGTRSMESSEEEAEVARKVRIIP